MADKTSVGILMMTMAKEMKWESKKMSHRMRKYFFVSRGDLLFLGQSSSVSQVLGRIKVS